jgi:hypothetical protein
VKDRANLENLLSFETNQGIAQVVETLDWDLIPRGFEILTIVVEFVGKDVDLRLGNKGETKGSRTLKGERVRRSRRMKRGIRYFVGRGKLELRAVRRSAKGGGRGNRRVWTAQGRWWSQASLD